MRFAAFALAVLAAPQAYAQSDEARAACFTERPLTAALVAETGKYGYSAFGGDEAAPPVVVGTLSPTRDAEDAQDVFGSVLFIRDGAGAWRAMLPRVGESVVAAYSNGAGGVLVATMWTSEGPGGAWMMLRSTDALHSASCSEIAFPGTLNQPTYNMEFLELHDLDINARGRGEIIGVANTEERGALWFAYRTRDHGATWSTPRRINGARNARAGVYAKIDVETAPEALLAELNAYAAGR